MYGWHRRLFVLDGARDVQSLYRYAANEENGNETDITDEGEVS